MSQKTKERKLKESKKQYSKEEVAEMRAQMLEYYNTEIPFLKLQLEFEDLGAQIEESKARKYVAMAQAAQAYGMLYGDNEKGGKENG